MPAPIIAGLGAAGIAAEVGKSAATVGLSAVREMFHNMRDVSRYERFFIV